MVSWSNAHTSHEFGIQLIRVSANGCAIRDLPCLFMDVILYSTRSLAINLVKKELGPKVTWALFLILKLLSLFYTAPYVPQNPCQRGSAWGCFRSQSRKKLPVTNSDVLFLEENTRSRKSFSFQSAFPCLLLGGNLGHLITHNFVNETILSLWIVIKN